MSIESGDALYPHVNIDIAISSAVIWKEGLRSQPSVQLAPGFVRLWQTGPQHREIDGLGDVAHPAQYIVTHPFHWTSGKRFTFLIKFCLDK